MRGYQKLKLPETNDKTVVLRRVSWEHGCYDSNDGSKTSVFAYRAVWSDPRQAGSESSHFFFITMIFKAKESK
jgi:hypothetical protein